jgi:pimeloyl-ACP methyl ester carboxylesterase
VATFVLVHGGGHGGWCYKQVKRRLELAGHEVFAPSMAGMAQHSRLLSPKIDLDHHIDDIASELFYWDLTEVILVGHSYGGMVITGVADRACERIGKLVYLDAANPNNGDSLAELAGAQITTQRRLGKIVDDTEMVMFPETYPLMWQAKGYFGVNDPTERAWLQERLTPQPWRTFEQQLRLTREDAIAAIPQYHIVCEDSFRYRESTEPIQRAIAENRLWRIDTGHDLMITEPDAVTQMLREIADRA